MNKEKWADNFCFSQQLLIAVLTHSLSLTLLTQGHIHYKTMVRQYQLWITTFFLYTQVIKINIVQVAARNGNTILFIKTQRGSDCLADNLVKAGVPVGALHGGKSQAARTHILKLFKEKKTQPSSQPTSSPAVFTSMAFYSLSM